MIADCGARTRVVEAPAPGMREAGRAGSQSQARGRKKGSGDVLYCTVCALRDLRVARQERVGRAKLASAG